MSSDTEFQEQQQDEQNSIWNGRLKTNAKEAKFFLEFLDALSTRFDGMPTDDILNTFWGEPRDVLEKSIKKANKKEKKADAKFTPEGLKKPSTANILFQRDFKAKCDKNNTKFDLKSSADAYKKLTEKEKAKYVKESERLKAEYKAEYDRLRAAAIQTGTFPADKPKKPMTAYFRYLQVVRVELAAKYADEEDRKAVNGKIAKDSAEMWKALSDKEKEKYESAYRREKDQYDEIIKRWESTETTRRKGQAEGTAAAAPVKIESSGSDKKKKAAATPAKSTTAPTPAATSATASAATSATASENEASEAEEQEVPKKPAKSSKVTPAKTITESEQEEEPEEPVAKPTKAKANSKANSKVKAK
jgi:hypothetical protein